MDLRTRLDRWLRKQLTLSSDDGPVEKLVIRHVPIGKRSTEVDSFDCPADNSDKAICDLRDDIALFLESDSGGLPGDVQSYMVQAFRKGKVRGRITVRMARPEDDVDLDGPADSEPASKQGHMAQMMRQNEGLVKLALEGQAKASYLLMRITDRLMTQNETMEETRIKNIELTESLLTGQHDREMDARDQDRKDRSTGELIETVKTLGPAIVNRLTGKNGEKLLPEPESPKDLALKAFLGSLSDEQKAEFANNLKPAQLVALMELTQGGGEKDNAH